MLEIISNLARWSQLTANLILFGSCIFLAVIGQQKSFFTTFWVSRLKRILYWMASIVLIGLLVLLATTTGEATGDPSSTWNPQAWLKFIQQTQVGFIGAVRIFLAAILLGISIYMLRRNPTRWHYVLCAVVASLPLIAGTFVSHSSADEMSFTSIAPFTLHILLAGIWFGALPAFLLILFSNQRESKEISSLSDALYLEKFSAIAMPVMLLLVATGLIVTDRMVEDSYHTLVSSPYGWLLNTKLIILMIILIIAYQARYRWLPELDHTGTTQLSESKSPITSALHLKKWIRIEFVLALILMFFATILANTLPAKHAIIENWPFPFRFSIDATWDEPYIEERFWSGTVLFCIALSLIWLGLRLNWNWKKKILIPAALTITAMTIALPPITIEAYPETYLKPLIPLDAISISHGSKLYIEHCARCHGPQGKANGELAESLSTKPTDLLTEPHTAKHTIGNYFHWISQGIPGTDMPGYLKIFSEEDIWDVVNFLHTLSRGFDARLLGTMIIPESPGIASPVFNYAANDGSTGELKDFRRKKNVILVLFSWPQSQQRLIQLKHAYKKVSEFNAEVLAVPMRQLSELEIKEISEIIPFPLITEGWSEIRDTYMLYRRVRAVPDLTGSGMMPSHMEFMTDRFGYLRARWVSQFEGFGWQNINALTYQLDLLNKEKEILPPPDDHAH